MLRLFTPRVSPLMRELWELDRLSNALFNVSWGRDISSRETATVTAPVHQTPEGDWKMEIYVDVHKFKPNEITTKDGLMSVDATASRTNSDGSLHSQFSLKRVLPIPDGVDKSSITAKFTEEGGVLLEAPAEPPKTEEAVTEDPSIPITHN